MKARTAKRTSASALRARLREVEKRHKVVMAAIRESVYDWDIAHERFTVARGMHDMLGLTGQRLTLAAWQKKIHPEDFSGFREATIAHLKGLTERFEHDYRYRARDGSWRWARTHGVAIRDRKGRAVRMIGSTGDVTQLKRTEEALRRSEERYALATAAAVEGIYEWDVESGTLFLSDHAKAFFAFPGEALTPSAWNRRVHPEDFPRYRAALIEHFKGLSEQLEIEYRVADARGGSRWVLDRGRVVRGTNGRVAKLVGALSDITHRKQAEIELRRARDEATEALERQTATSEILRVISTSPTDVQPVFDAIVRATAELCNGRLSTLLRFDGEFLHLAAHHNVGAEGLEAYRRVYPRRVSRETVAGWAILDRAVINLPDAQDEGSVPPHSRAMAAAAGFRSVLVVPMMRKGQPIGIINVARAEPGPFSETHIELLKTFADQAVIAIENARLFAETREALEQQQATADILKVISSSPTDTQPVFDAIASSGVRLFAGMSMSVRLINGDRNHRVAFAMGTGSAVSEDVDSASLPLDEQTISSRAILRSELIHIVDVQAEEWIGEESKKRAGRMGYRAVAAAPMFRDGKAVGVIGVTRAAAGPFSARQLALLRTFADQAVIAIENARLYSETKEALEQQTATADILRVISSSPTDLAPVFDAVAKSVSRLCEARDVVIVRAEGEAMRFAASVGPFGETFGADLMVPITRGSVAGRAVLERRTIHVEDLAAASEHDYPEGKVLQRRYGHRTMVAAPLLRGDVVLGAIAMLRSEVKPFSERQVKLIETFADHAVIAIENVRLFNETKEALEKQTAISEILEKISSSPTDMGPVLQAVAERAAHLCGAELATVLLVEGRILRTMVTYSADQGPLPDPSTVVRLDRGYITGRAALDRQIINLEDVLPLMDSEFAAGSENQRRFGYRSFLAVPLMRKGEAIGVIAIWRRVVLPFTDKHVALVKTFADQAAIAIENVRLFNETKEALEQQKASGEILAAIGSSIADTGPVFDKILDSCQRLFEGHIVGLSLAGEDGMVHLGAYKGENREETARMYPMPLNRESGTGCAILDRRVVHFADVLAPASGAAAHVRQGARTIGFKSIIFAPLMAEGRGIGALWVARRLPGPFVDKQIALLKTFADQAVIAIQNARLFREIEEKSRQLELANRHKSEFLANMSHELRTPLNAIIGFTRIVMRRSKEVLETKQYENLEKILTSAQHLLQLINAILDLSKVEAGRMELHVGDVPLAPVLEQCLRTVEPLVKAPAVRLVKEFDGELPSVWTDEEKLRQIVINLLSNAAKFTERGTVRVSASCGDDAFAVAVADTGIGIPPDKLERVFEEFAQADASSTRVYGGTGLGLTIARRLARLMGGDIAVQSAVGAGSTFTLTLPLRLP